MDSAGAARAGLDTALVLEQLQRIVGSKDFDASERNRRFLRYVVEEMLAGRGERIKAYNIATAVFDRDEGFDPQSDPIVRIEASRLRRSLDRYYLTAGRDDVIRITVPKGSYVPDVKQLAEKAGRDPAEVAREKQPTQESTGIPRKRLIAFAGAAALVVLLVVASGILWWSGYFAKSSGLDLAASPRNGPAILVAPFDNDGGLRQHDDVVHGFTREVVTGLNEQDLGNKVLSRFVPGEPMIVPGLKPGESRKSALQVSVYDLSDLKKVTHSGSLDVTYTCIGAYRVTVPGGTYDAVLIRCPYDGKIGPAHQGFAVPVSRPECRHGRHGTDPQHFRHADLQRPHEARKNSATDSLKAFARDRAGIGSQGGHERAPLTVAGIPLVPIKKNSPDGSPRRDAHRAQSPLRRAPMRSTARSEPADVVGQVSQVGDRRHGSAAKYNCVPEPRPGCRWPYYRRWRAVEGDCGIAPLFTVVAVLSRHVCTILGANNVALGSVAGETCEKWCGERTAAIHWQLFVAHQNPISRHKIRDVLRVPP